MDIKRYIKAFISFMAIVALLSVYAGIIADEPLHCLIPDPDCATCQAINGVRHKW